MGTNRPDIAFGVPQFHTHGNESASHSRGGVSKGILVAIGIQHMAGWRKALLFYIAGLATWCVAQEPDLGPAAGAEPPKAGPAVVKFIQSYCIDCHSKSDPTGELALDELIANDFAPSSQRWERVVRKLAARQMPPLGSTRPSEESYQEALESLESALDAAAARAPNPGRTETFRRLTRTEYRNVIRDLLDLEIDVDALLPADESSHGFDNITVTDLSPTLLNRYLAAAEKIARLAVGASVQAPRGETIRVRPDLTQDVHIPGLPIGTRGGALVAHHFPFDGEYEIQVHLMRDRNEEVEGLHEAHELEILLDRESIKQFTIKPPAKGETNQSIDANLTLRLQVEAGPHQLGAAFLQRSSSLLETTRQPLNVHFNYYRHPRIGPAIYEISIVGPFESKELTKSKDSGEKARRGRVFSRHPPNVEDEDACAQQIIARLARQAYRRPVTEDDLTAPLGFFRQARAESGFEAGIEAALSMLLINPHFLFRIERDPLDLMAGSAYRISDLELASRLSFFLWTSAPDEELLATAERDELHRPQVLEKQVLRMLKDERARALTENFAGQWLYLKNLESVTPDMRLYPDFDDNLRQAMRRETELFFESMVREDRSLLDLIKADYTFLNERLAKHYGLPHVYGDRFRRIALDESSHRGGLLRQGSILTVTSYATRTSPVIRGHWILANLVGAAPPPAPPDVPTLQENTVSNRLPMRERLKEHRANAACASCHNQMDPIGFALENFDAIGRWREMESERPIDNAGGFIDGGEFNGIEGLEQALLRRPELFVRTVTEKLLTFALGRGVEHDDAPAIRKIVRGARAEDYRFSALILGIVQSAPFQMRRMP
jgi:hypothetical protein